MGVMPEKLGENICSGFCSLLSSVCVNVPGTLAQIRHSQIADSFRR